jgi:ZU5 domain
MGTSMKVLGLARIAALAAPLVCAACGGSSTPAPQSAVQDAESSGGVSGEVTSEVHKRGSKKLIAEIGPPGGTLELDNGARLTIPSGALSETVEFTFSEGSRTTAFSNHEYERAIGPTLEIAPGAALSSPVQVSVPITTLPEGFREEHLTLGLEVPSSAQRLESQNVQTRWDYLPAESKSGRAVASLSEVPGFRVQFLVSKND